MRAHAFDAPAHTRRKVLFAPLGSARVGGGLVDHLLCGPPDAMLRAFANWGTVLSTTPTAITPEQALRRAVETMSLRRFYFSYALLRPADALLFGTVGPSLFCRFNAPAALWGSLDVPRHSVVVDVGTSCAFDAEQRQRIVLRHDALSNDASEGGTPLAALGAASLRNLLNCTPLHKPRHAPCAVSLLRRDGVADASLGVAALALVCGLGSGGAALTTSRCALAATLRHRIRSVLWSKCCADLPAVVDGDAADTARACGTREASARLFASGRRPAVTLGPGRADGTSDGGNNGGGALFEQPLDGAFREAEAWLSEHMGAVYDALN